MTSGDMTLDEWKAMSALRPKVHRPAIGRGCAVYNPAVDGEPKCEPTCRRCNRLWLEHFLAGVEAEQTE